MKYTHLDLFAGIGGFSLASKWAGIETIQFVEIDPFCQKVLQKNFPDVPIHGDIKTFTVETYQQACKRKEVILKESLPVNPFLLTGGFP